MVYNAILALAAKQASRSAPRLRRAPITLTDSAARRVKALLSKRNQVRSLLLQFFATWFDTPSLGRSMIRLACFVLNPQGILEEHIHQAPTRIFCAGIPQAGGKEKRMQWACIYLELCR